MKQTRGSDVQAEHPEIAARLDRLPITWELAKTVILISLGFGFEIYDIFLTGYIAPVLAANGFFTPESLGSLSGLGVIGIQGAGTFVFALFAGLYCGSVLLGGMADRFGRRAVFTYSLVWYSICTGVMASQSTGLWIDVWRFMAGIGLGVELVTIDAFLAEIVPAKYRGRAFAFCQCVGFSFVPLVAFLAWRWNHATVMGIDGWRMVVMVGAVGACGAWYLRRALPESPRWLMSQGKTEEAARIIGALERRRSESDLPTTNGIRNEKLPHHEPVQALTAREIQNRKLVLSIFNFFQTFGYYGFSVWVPTLLIARGIEITKSLEYAFLIAVSNPVGPVIGLIIGDYLERKWQIVIAAIAVGTFGILFATANSILGIILCGVGITIANNVMSYAFHGYQSELFPTRLRSRSVGFVYSWSRFSAALSGPIVAALLAIGGPPSVFAWIAVSMAVVVVSIGVFAPRSSQMQLENLAS